MSKVQSGSLIDLALHRPRQNCVECGALYSYPASKDIPVEGTDFKLRGEWECVGCRRKNRVGRDPSDAETLVHRWRIHMQVIYEPRYGRVSAHVEERKPQETP